MSLPASPSIWHRLAIGGTLATAALVATRPLSHDDLFLHLHTGELVARTWHVPVRDPFTHTVLGTAWTSHEWGFGLLLHALHSIAGLPGLVALLPVLVIGLLLLLYREMRARIAPERLALAVPLLLLGLAAAEPTCILLRAALLTTTGIALTMLAMRRLRERSTPRLRAGIALGFLLWANVHAGVVFGVLVLGLHVLQALLDRWLLAPRPRTLRELFDARVSEPIVLLCVCTALTMLNPSGAELWTFGPRVNDLLYRSGLSWAPSHFAPPSPAHNPAFFALVALVLAACLPLRRLREMVCDPRTPGLASALGTLIFSVLALRSNRFVIDFVVLALPFCAQRWGARSAPRPHAAASARSPRLAYELGPLALLIGGLALVRPAPADRLLARTTPVALADFMQRENVRGRMFNYEAFGGYLGWRLHQPVYWDGRGDILLKVAWEFAYKKDLGDLIEHHRLELLILDESYHHAFGPYLEAHAQQWGLVFWDDIAALYVKRIPRYARLLAGEYRLLRPFGVPQEGDIVRLARDDRLRERAEAEIGRALHQSAESWLAWYLRGRLAGELGRHAEAHAALARAASLDAKPTTLYHLGRTALALGKEAEARAWLERASATLER